MVILLSAFNGIEQMVEKLYSDFDPDITIRSARGKTFFDNQIDLTTIKKTPGVLTISKGIEEVVVIKHESKWVNARMIGVEEKFLDITKMSGHMVDGYPFLKEEGEDLGLIGATLLDKLEGFIPSTGFETVIIYSPKRDIKMKLGRNPFETQIIKLSGRINYNREVNSECIVVPMHVAQNLLDFQEDESTVIYLDIDNSFSNEEVKKQIQEKVGNDFVIKTNYEKNELIYKTSQSEKIIVIIILLFIFVIAAFTLVGALTMLYIEKKDNLETLYALGADKNFVFRIFFIEGLLISFKGIFFGLLIGYSVCFVQIYASILTMPNSAGEPFPIGVTFQDGFMIFGMVSILSLLASYLPAKFLRRNEGRNNK